MQQGDGPKATSNSNPSPSSAKTSTLTRPGERLLLGEQFMLGGAAGTMACVFTNPIEVCKTRLQLQGELTSRGPRVYSGPFDAFRKILKNEGLMGVQKGFVPAVMYQIALNGTRLGLFDTLKTFYQPLPFAAPLAGATSGVIAAFVGSPFFLVKIRMQSFSEHLPVGTQYRYTSLVGALLQIGEKEGLQGLWRGATGSMLRVAIGSGVQLSTFEKCKSLISQSPMFLDLSTRFSSSRSSSREPSPVAISIGASLLSGFVTTIAMNPVDVVSTRLYNQPVDPVTGKGLLYSNPFDCMVKIVRTEGFRGFYKGFLAHYLRLGPHSVLTLVFWDLLKHHKQQWDQKKAMVRL